MFDMTTDELSWTQNVAELGRDLNGALYATWVRSEDEADPANGSVSHISPLARALIGKRVGDEANVAGQSVEIIAVD